MTQQTESIKAKFIKLQNLLASETKTDTTVHLLQELIQFFKSVDILDETIAKNQVYDELRDTVKNIFTYVEKVKVPTTTTQKRIEELIREILISISKFCSAYYCQYHPYGCGEMIKQFLSSECRFFVPDFGAAPTSIIEKDTTQQQIDKTKWVWVKESSFKTLFYCECVETIMLNLCKFQQKFQEMHIPVIGQYLRLLYYIDDYLIYDTFANLCISHINLLQKIFSNPSKELMKDATKEKLEQISEYLLKLLRYNKNDDLKRRVQFLGPLLGITMMKMSSIEKKLIGCKIVSKFSYEMLYRSTSYVSENSFAQWIVQQNFFQIIFEDNCQTSLVKSSEDTFKLLVKRGQLKSEQFHRFFQILQKAEADLRKAMFRLIDPFRVDYYQIEAMLNIFNNIRGAEFYDDQFFYFMEGLSRYSTQKQLKKMIAITEAIIKQNYNKFESYLTRRRSVQCYAYIFERLITYKDINERIDAYAKIAEGFIEDPSQNKLIVLKSLFQGLSEYKMEKSYQETLCSKVIVDVQFIEKSLKYAKQIKFRDDLITVIKTLLKKYGSGINKAPFSQESLIETVDFPEVFEEMLKTVTASSQFSLVNLFDKLSSLSAVKDFPFSCLKHVFIRLNWKVLRPIKKEYTDLIGTYVTYVNPEEFVGVDTLKYLIFNSTKRPVRQGACQLLVQIYTNLADDFREEGELYLIQFMKNILLVIEHKLKNFVKGEETVIAALGSLELMEDLLLNTEYFGVGSLKAHNSLIPTSTVSLKVFNNCSYRDDVLKIFEKKFPSNKTLFQVILEVSKQFKMGPLDMCFQYPTGEMIRYNGLTLEELKLNRQEINAIKLPQSRLKKEFMLIDDKLTPKAIKAFTEMFYKFAPDGKMTSKQCAAYIQGVTLSFCPIFDSRINSLYAEYDSDKDKILTLDDFLRFYYDSIVDPEKAQTVEKNLLNLGYRRDLRLYDDELDNLQEEVLFRYHIWQNQQIYEYLFQLSHHDNLQLASLSKLLILRLPTYPKIVGSLSDSVDLKNKNPFEVQYLLTALRSQIDQEQGFSSKLISSNNHLAIFQYLSQLCSKELKSQNQNNCLIICLYVLHSLLGLKNTGENMLKEFPQLAFTLPQTDVFITIIKENIKAGDSTLLQPTLALQLTQNTMSFDWIQQAVFNKDKDIRINTTGFLLMWVLKNHNKDINLFKIKINPQNNEQWFNFLTMLVNLDQNVDYSDIFLSKSLQIGSCSESLEENRFNPIIHGNLKIIREVYPHLKEQQKHELMRILHKLLPSLISNQNRELVYNLTLKIDPSSLIDTLQKIANVNMGKEAQPRNQYVGIRNLGCICYMNSILQQFFMIRQFKSLIMSLEPQQQVSQVNGMKIVDDFLYQLQKMYAHLEWSQKQYYDPSTFCLAIKDTQGKPINTHIQEDAHEFLNTAFDKLEGYSKKQEKLKSLEKIFGGKTVTQIICQTCKNKNEVLEHYYHLTLEVKGMKTLKDSFDKMIVPEEISDYFCLNCDKKVQKITKQTLIKEAPQILIINLQRIVFDLETFLKVKVHTKLQFQQVLDLHNYFSSSSKPAPYNLKGVVIHSGTSEGGHYYSLIKQDNKWFKFNDQSVSLFNELDIGREAFGGDEHTDTLGDLTSSTNAYILIYEKAEVNQEMEQHSQLNSIVQKFKADILAENKNFESQLQLYQPSYFNTLNILFELQYKSKNKDNLEDLFNIYLKIVEHLCINSDIKTQIINQIKDNFLKLLEMLPEKAQQILDNIPKSTFGQIICTHNDVNIRQIYQKMLSKALLTVIGEGQQLWEKANQLLDYLFDLLEDDLLLKNVYKSYQYFQLWKELINNKQVRKKMEERNLLGLYLDLLMGSDSQKSTKDKKRPDFSLSQGMPLIPVIINLLQTKLNLVNKKPQEVPDIQYTPLTDREQNILNNPIFYRKTMKNKLDMGLLSPIISLLSFQDEKYSKFIIQILIKAMNNNDEVEDKNVVFQNMKAFLLVDDQLTSERIKWTLGISQFDSISFIDQEYGMMTSPESKVVSYVSSYLFQKDEKCVPFLYSLFQKRKYYNSFSAHGIITLLELTKESQPIRQYMMTLPAPTYIHKTYFDWIQSYITRVKIEDHYSLPYDKKILAEKLQTLLQEVKEKMKQSPLYQNLPVNKLIIGKNAQKMFKGTLNCPQYTIQMWAHETYVLLNKPYGYGNFSLPDEQFSFASTAQPKTAKYFLKSAVIIQEGDQEKSQVEKQLTILSFNIKNSINLTLHFNIEGFRHKIYLKNGETVINCPFSEGQISDLVMIEKRQESFVEVQPEIKMNEVFSNEHHDYAAPTPRIQDFSYSCYSTQVNCKVCTYLNYGRETCQMCGTDLFK